MVAWAESLQVPSENKILMIFLAACGILVSWPGIEPSATAVGAPTPNYRTGRELKLVLCFNVRKSHSPSHHVTAIIARKYLFTHSI